MQSEAVGGGADSTVEVCKLAVVTMVTADVVATAEAAEVREVGAEHNSEGF